MAELVASAVGIAAFACQVGEKILKLKSFIDEVNEAPEEITYLITEMNVLRLLLSECSASLTEPSDGQMIPGISECQQLCLQGTEMTAKIVDEIHGEIKKNRLLGGFKVLVKKGTLARMRERVRDARSMLQLSRQIYSDAMHKQNNQQLVQLLLQQVESRTVFITAEMPLSPQNSSTIRPRSETLKDDDDPNLEIVSSTTSSCMVFKPKRQAPYDRGSVWNIYVEAPRWLRLTTKALQIHAQATPLSFNFGLRMYNAVPNDALVMQYARSGNVDAMRKLFDTGLASPFDQSDGRISILTIAAFKNNIDVCRFLIEECLSLEVDRPERLLMFSIFLTMGRTGDGYREFLGLLAQVDDLPDPLDLLNARRTDPAYQGDAEGLSWVIKRTRSLYFQQSLEHRRQIALDQIVRGGTHDVVNMVRLLVGSGALPPAFCQITNQGGRGLLHCIAKNIGEKYITSPMTWEAYYLCQDGSGGSDDLFRFQDLLRLLHESIRGGSRVHAIGAAYDCWQRFETPLAGLNQGFFSANNQNGPYSFHRCDSSDGPRKILTSGPNYPINGFTVPLMIWLEELSKAGLDLVKYGRRERRIWSSSLAHNLFHYRTWNVAKSRDTVSRYSIFFIYGPNPRDWHFWIIEQLDASFHQFWDMIDHPEWAFSIPGSWEEEETVWEEKPLERPEQYPDSEDDSDSEYLEEETWRKINPI